MLKTRNFLAYQELSCTIFFKLSFGYFFQLFFALFVAVNEVNSKRTQISRIVINSHFQRVSSALEITFQIPGLFKDVHESW